MQPNYIINAVGNLTIQIINSRPRGFVKPTSFNGGLVPIFPVRYNFIEVGYLRGIPKVKLFEVLFGAGLPLF